MENLIIKQTQHTPEIELNTNGTLTFKGKSYSENTFDFYEPIENWINEYLNTYSNNIEVTFDLNYLNSSSIKFYFDMFDKFEEYIKKDKKITIKWLYDKDDDMTLEAGEDFQEDYNQLNIQLIEKD